MIIQENIPLAPHTTLGVGGPARWFVRIADRQELLAAVGFAHPRRLPIFVLGGGSNLLVADAGFPGLVIHAVFGDRAVIHPPTQFLHPATNPTHMTVCADAGTVWDDFVLSLCRQGISGVECLAGIPGLVGGSPIQNIGAYGQEAATTIRSVTALDLDTQAFVTLPREACRFAYRSSLFNTTHRGRYIITAVEFQFDLAARPDLSYADLARHFAAARTPPSPLEVYHAVRAIRARKGMLLVEGDPDSRSAGSFFKNPVVDPATVNHIADTLAIAPHQIPQWAVLESMGGPSTTSAATGTAPAGQAVESKIKLPAAWLVERAGFSKGFQMGRAAISSKHTLALINLGGATAAEIVALRDAIQHEVEARFAIRLEQEPVPLGF